jgi:hypothetical protein
MSVEEGEGVAYHVDTSRYLRHFVARLGLRRKVGEVTKSSTLLGQRRHNVDQFWAVCQSRIPGNHDTPAAASRLCPRVVSSEIMSRSRLRS